MIAACTTIRIRSKIDKRRDYKYNFDNITQSNLYNSITIVLLYKLLLKIILFAAADLSKNLKVIRFKIIDKAVGNLHGSRVQLQGSKDNC